MLHWQKSAKLIQFIVALFSFTLTGKKSNVGIRRILEEVFSAKTATDVRGYGRLRFKDITLNEIFPHDRHAKAAEL